MKRRVYLDACCLNRPFDDQGQDRVRLESEAIILILGHIEKGDLLWVGSDALIFEINQTPSLERRRRVIALARGADEMVPSSDLVLSRAREIEQLGFGGYDALHLASAEMGKADTFLTTDDKLVKRATRLGAHLQVVVANPVTWLWEGEHDS